MPFDAPELETIRLQMRGSLAAKQFLDADGNLVVVGPLPPRSVLGVLAADNPAAQFSLLHRHAERNALDGVPLTSTGQRLEDWASTFRVNRRPATFASGTIDLTGVTGTLVPTGTTWRRTDGRLFSSIADVTVAAGVASVTVRADEVGLASNTAAAATLSLVVPIAGLDTDATVDSNAIGAGADEETLDQLRARLLEFLRQRPNGGSVADYVSWSKEVPGVTRAWALGHHLGPGTVGVAIVNDGNAPAISPSAQLVSDVATLIGTRRPVTAQVTVFAPGLTQLDPQIQMKPNTATVQQAVTQALDDLFLREAVPGQLMPLTHIAEAISNAAGEEDHRILAPLADVQPLAGELLVTGTPVFSTLP